MAAALEAAAGWMGDRWLSVNVSPSFLASGDPAPKEFIVKKGASARSLGQQLQSQGFLADARVWRFHLWRRGAEIAPYGRLHLVTGGRLGECDHGPRFEGIERFGDATDMCSLVNAKSGGCAEDCGFCAQSRYAEADTPMHAMMEPDQILEHARAAEAAGAHRFCMVTQGQGLSKRDFQKVLEGTRLVAQHTNLKRCASIGHMSAKRAKQLREAGIQRVHHNVETARSYYDEVTSTVQYEGRLRTIQAVREAGLETCVGGILNLGESRAQRVEMAFELAEIDPTSVPINLLNPRPGTKFGDRDYMDPWEAVKWIAVFRLILPDALFRLCGGRNENLGQGEFAVQQHLGLGRAAAAHRFGERAPGPPSEPPVDPRAKSTGPGKVPADKWNQ